MSIEPQPSPTEERLEQRRTQCSRQMRPPVTPVQAATRERPPATPLLLDVHRDLGQQLRAAGGEVVVAAAQRPEGLACLKGVTNGDAEAGG